MSAADVDGSHGGDGINIGGSRGGDGTDVGDADRSRFRPELILPNIELMLLRFLRSSFF